MATDPLASARETLLCLVADARRFELEADADQTETGRWIDCSRVHLTTTPRELADLIFALGFEGFRGEAHQDPVQFLIDKAKE